MINAVKAGEPLIIFPEGRLTVTGSLMKIYDGAGPDRRQDRRLRRAGAARRARRRRRSRGCTSGQIRRRWFPKVTVTVLEPVKLTVDPALKGKHRRMAAGAALYEIMSNLVYRTTSIERTVIEALIEAAEVHGMGRVAVEDPIAGTLSYRKLLMGARILGEKLMPLAPEGKPIGVMLPNANGAAVTLMALMSAGRVPAMINFTAGVANVLAACRAAKMDTILTSRAFVEKGRLDALIAGLQKEDQDRLSRRHPPDHHHDGQAARLLELQEAAGARASPTTGRRCCSPRAPEGTPKGVVLTHRNMMANTAQAAARIDFGRQDKVFNVLPVFHSFGLTVGLVLPLVSGVRIYLYPSPLHYRIVPELVYGVNATILFGTDTFLNGYARSAHAYDFRSLRYILAGAEPVKEFDAARLSGKVRPAHPRRLRRHRDRAGAGAQHADVQQVRHRRAAAAGHAGAAGQGRGRRRGRPALRQGPERHGRLSPHRESRRAGAAAGRLARHRRHRHHRRAGLHRHQGPRQALRQDRRRDDLVCGGGGAGRRAVAGRAVGGGVGAGRAQGRAADHGDAEEGPDAQRIPGVRRARAAPPRSWCRPRSSTWKRCRCSAPARSTTWR